MLNDLKYRWAACTLLSITHESKLSPVACTVLIFS